MATFNFGIGLQVEGNAADAAREFTTALTGLNAALQEISQSQPDMSRFTAGLDDAAQRAVQATQEVGAAAAEHIGGAITDASQQSAEAVAEAGDAVQEHLGDSITDSTDQSMDAFSRLRTAIQNDLIDSLLEAGVPAEQIAADIEDMTDEAIGYLMDLSDEAEENADELQISYTEAIYMVTNELYGLAATATDVLGQLQRVFTGGQDTQIEYDLVRLNAQMGLGADAGRRMATQVEDLASKHDLNALAVSASAQAIQASGVVYTELGERAQETAARMVDVFKIDPAAVGEATASAQIMGDSLDNLANISAEIGQISKVPGLIEQLPGALDFAREAQATFATTVGKSGPQITNDIQRMTALYSKALGKSAPEAARLARETFSRFAKGIQQNRDVFLGLADDFDPLTNAMLEAGLSFDEAQDMMALPTQGPEGQMKFLEQVQRMKDTMDPMVFERFYRQLQTQGGDAINQLLTLNQDQIHSSEDVTAAMAAQRLEQENADPAVKAAREQAAAFQQMSETMRDSVGGAFERVENQINNLVNTFQAAFRGDIKDGIMDASKLFGDLIDWVMELRTEFGPLIKEWGPFISKIAMGATLAGPALSAIGTALGPIQTVTQGLLRLANLAGSILPESLGTAVGAAGSVAIAVGLVDAGAGPAAESMRELSDASLMTKTSGEQMGTVFGSLLQGALQTVDNLLGGYPSKLLGVSDGFGSVQTTITDFFSNLPQTVETFFAETFTPDNLMKVGQFFADIGNKVLDALGHLPGAVMNIFQGALNFITDIFGSIVRGVMKAFGADGSTIEMVNLFLDSMKLGFQLVIGGIRQKFEELVGGIALGVADAGHALGVLTDEQEAALRNFAQSQADATTENERQTAALREQIEARKRNIAAMREHEAEVAAAGGEDAYRQRQQVAELRRIQEDRAAAAHPGVPRSVAIAMQQAEERAQRAQAQQVQPTTQPAATQITEPAAAPAASETPPAPSTGAPTTAPGGATTPTTAPADVGTRAGTVPPTTTPPPGGAPTTPARPAVTVTFQWGNTADRLARAFRETMDQALTEREVRAQMTS